MNSIMGNDKEVVELIDNFFFKSTLLICSTKSNKLQTPLDEVPHFDEEWFLKGTDEELELPEIIKQWSNFDGARELPPLVIETYLDLRNLGPQDSVHLKDEEGNSWSVCRGSKKSEIVLERWLIELDSLSAAFKSHKVSEEESNSLSRQFVLLFRYLYTLTQLLPANDLYLSLSKNVVSHGTLPLISVSTRILDGSKPILSKGRIGLSKPIISAYSNVINESNVPSHLEQRKITPVWTKYGLLRVSVSYRRDCHFEVHHDNEEEANIATTTTTAGTPAARRPSQNQQQSVSLSPHGHAGSLNSMEQQSLPRKPLSITRQLQPFKVGSVGSAPIPQPHALTRNPSSSSSILANLQAQRSTNSSMWGPTQQQITPHGGDLHVESTSAGSTSKYSSSFDRLRRHSSVKYNDLPGERPLKPAKMPSDSQPTEDLLDFVKMMNDRPELNIRRSPRASVDISNSLMKFQNLKPTNDIISENLNLSLSLDPSHTFQSHSHRSNSHSPLPSYSPNFNYPLIPSKFSQPRSLSHDGDSVMGVVTSRRNSSDVLSKNGASNRTRNNSVSSSRRPSESERGTTTPSFTPGSDFNHENCPRSNYQREESIEDEDEEGLLVNRSGGSSATRIKSMDSISTSISKNRLPIRQPSNYSQPTTTAVPAYAKLHRPGARSAEQQREESSRKLENSITTTASTPNPATTDDSSPHGEDNDDEDLLFFMSDMNLSKM
ncbi:ZYRO0D00924p [Zygosaccharomyces rouxii]|uniref:Autophagy-related protein 13 n=1 Tax=Zygosaccharomyces rouxii (strain ATCC 2623 / CBS 732 / NBRC 1130 / NCYC 568 / NRRL Y-229) TaxID=559307 RepID=C5DUS2_ZYGRC|nr:uncharacterized protein ZYRO0D00924g [Zygosaccharomyces rouxii]KAH9200458.1 autophagy-related protein 13-domain-containing protein [Zygosaccharomyces rouxii]CAR27541.1 ZYRO0D00924p [Zygosaccharomyces rouxii]